MTTKKILLAIFAHPDDEAFGTGGTLSKYAAEGGDVHLITATCGEAGQIVDPSLATPDTLCEVRQRELADACRAYGINPPHLLHYPDGQTTVVNQKEAVGKVVHVIRRVKPQVVLAFGPDGIYGHYDHIALHRWATIAVRLAADPHWYAEQLADGLTPHVVSKVYHRATSRRQLALMQQNGRGAVMMDGVPFPFVGFDVDQITTVIDIRAYAAQKRAGILCHATQVRDREQFANGNSPFGELMFSEETYILAHSSVPVEPGPETDLFAGL